VLRRVFALALVTAVGCTLLNPLDEFDRGSERDAGDDVATLDAEVDGACQIHRWPTPPDGNGGAGEGNIEFLNAVRALRLGATVDAATTPVPSYDLDGVCTCPGAGSCTPLANAKVACDDDGGADNAGGQLAVDLTALAGSSPDITAAIATGAYGLLLKVTGYNGSADDARVALSIFLSNGSAGSELEGGTPTTPKFDGNDEWTIDPSSVNGAKGPPYTPKLELSDLNAYVTGGVLVASVSFPVRIGSLIIELAAGRLTGRIVQDPAGYHIEDGVLIGRWPAAKLLTSLAVIEDPVREQQIPNAGVCGDSGLYPSLKKQICDTLDIAAVPAQDSIGAACSAVAISMRFSSSMARFGALYMAPPKVPRDCPSNWADDCAR
jgi:hypothetical protein